MYPLDVVTFVVDFYVTVIKGKRYVTCSGKKIASSEAKAYTP